MDLQSLIATNKSIEIEYPDMPGFKVQVNYLSKEEIRKISQKSKTFGFDKKTHQPIETIDDDIFTEIYVSKALTGWTGLTLNYLSQLVVMENAVDSDEEVPFKKENALVLIKNSPDFDGWLSSVMSDISVFNRGS